MKPKYPWERVGNTAVENARARATAHKMWRYDHVGQPEPDDEIVAKWFADIERDMLRAEWQDAHPGQPIPDDYQVVRRWGINSHNRRAVQRAKDSGEPFN